MKIGKYEFDNKEQAESKINALPSDDEGNPNHKHTIVKLGNIVLSQGEYDEDGTETTAPEFSDKYHVDCCWVDLTDHPYGWKSFKVEPEDEGVHSFWGVSYLENKI